MVDFAKTLLGEDYVDSSLDDEDGEDEEQWDFDMGALLDGLLASTPPPYALKPVDSTPETVAESSGETVGGLPPGILEALQGVPPAPSARASEGGEITGSDEACTIETDRDQEKSLPTQGLLRGDPPMLVELGRWAAQTLKSKGGRMGAANLGAALSACSANMYREIKANHQSLVKMLAKLPEIFLLEQDAPYNHVVLRKEAIANLGQGGPSLPDGVGKTSSATSALLEFELLVLDKARDILIQKHTPGNRKPPSLPAVVVANLLKQELGKPGMRQIKRRHGGLLRFLERSQAFRVDRVPKADIITLVERVEQRANRVPPEDRGDGTLASLLYAPTRLKRENPEKAFVGNGPNSEKHNAARCLHVGNLPDSMGILELQKVFQLFGTVEHVQIARSGTSSMHHGKRIPQRRFAFVQFAQAKDAQQAKERLSEHHKMLRANISYSRQLSRACLV